MARKKKTGTGSHRHREQLQGLWKIDRRHVSRSFFMVLRAKLMFETCCKETQLCHSPQLCRPACQISRPHSALWK